MISQSGVLNLLKSMWGSPLSWCCSPASRVLVSGGRLTTVSSCIACRPVDYGRVVPTACSPSTTRSGIVEFARSLHELGWGLVSSGGTAPRIADAGLPRHRRRRTHRAPRHPRPPGRHPSSEDPRRHPRRSRPMPSTSPTWSTTASSRSTSWSSTSTRSVRPEHRADRHRRACDGARRGEEPRPCRRGRRPGRLRSRSR